MKLREQVGGGDKNEGAAIEGNKGSIGDRGYWVLIAVLSSAIAARQSHF